MFGPLRDALSPTIQRVLVLMPRTINGEKVENFSKIETRNELLEKTDYGEKNIHRVIFIKTLLRFYLTLNEDVIVYIFYARGM